MVATSGDLYEAVPADLRHHLSQHERALGVVAAGWYPMSVVHPIVDEMARAVDSTTRTRLIQETAKAIMEQTLRGVYKVMFDWMATPQRYARHCNRLWRLYFDEGAMEVVVGEEGVDARCTVRDWGGHHRVICDLNLAAASEIYRAMGLSDVRSHRTSCVSEGSEACCFRTTWKLSA